MTSAGEFVASAHARWNIDTDTLVIATETSDAEAISNQHEQRTTKSEVVSINNTTPTRLRRTNDASIVHGSDVWNAARAVQVRLEHAHPAAI